MSLELSNIAVTVTVDGDSLILSLDSSNAPDDIESALEYVSNDCGDDIANLSNLLESYWTNGQYYVIESDDVTPPIGMTDAPFIAESLYGDDDNPRQHLEGRAWYFPNYMVESPVETLLRNGKVIFSFAVDAPADSGY